MSYSACGGVARVTICNTPNCVRGPSTELVAGAILMSFLLLLFLCFCCAQGGGFIVYHANKPKVLSPVEILDLMGDRDEVEDQLEDGEKRAEEVLEAGDNDQRKSLHKSRKRAATATAKDPAQSMFDRFDQNKDGKIDFAEFSAIIHVFMKDLDVDDEDEVDQAFSLIDADNSGAISVKELSLFMDALQQSDTKGDDTEGEQPNPLKSETTVEGQTYANLE